MGLPPSHSIQPVKVTSLFARRLNPRLPRRPWIHAVASARPLQRVPSGLVVVLLFDPCDSASTVGAQGKPAPHRCVVRIELPRERIGPLLTIRGDDIPLPTQGV